MNATYIPTGTLADAVYAHALNNTTDSVWAAVVNYMTADELTAHIIEADTVADAITEVYEDIRAELASV